MAEGDLKINNINGAIRLIKDEDGSFGLARFSK